MSPLDRRTLLRTCAVVTLAAAAPARLAAARMEESAEPALFLYDPRCREALEEAQAWRARGVEVLDVRRGDLGVAWRETIAPLVNRRGPGALRGRTLGSDRMISTIFAREQGLRLLEEPLPPGVPASQTRRWRLA